MSTEDKETQMSVQEALSMMAPAFKKMDSKNLKMIEALVATYIEKEEHQVRQVAVQYAGGVFPPSHTPSKFVLLLGKVFPFHIFEYLLGSVTPTPIFLYHRIYDLYTLLNENPNL